MKRSLILVCAAAFALLATNPQPGWAGEDPVIGEVLGILLDRGDIDQAKYTELVAKSEAHQAKQASLLGRIELSGDIRGRLENFWFDEDATGFEESDRTRGRYRVRIQGKAKVNDHVTAGFRLASGGDRRSTNQTLGGGGLDFAPDSIFIDRAYIELRPHLDKNLKVVIGKQSNPFRWKKGKDYMLWDGDVNPEGIAVKWKTDVSDDVSVFANTGYMVLDENSSRKDPSMFAIQGGVHASISETVSVGGRVSWYSFNSLDMGVIGRGNGVGNLALTERLDDGINVFELAGYVACGCSETWPVLAYFHYAQNTDADDATTGDEEDTGWGVGIEVGDKKKIAKLGFGYYELEANFFPAQFTDSDLFDGFTNREGFTVYGSKQIWKNTDLNVTFFMGDEIEDGIGFVNSTVEADRMRLQTDIVVKF